MDVRSRDHRKSGTLPTGIIVTIVIVIAIAFAVILISTIVGIVCWRWRRAKAKAELNKEDYDPKHGGISDKSNRGMFKKQQVDGSASEEFFQGEHVDQREWLIPHHIPPNRLSNLIKAIYARRMPTPQATFSDKTVKPEITKVIQYGTEDQITIAEPKTPDEADPEAPNDVPTRVLVQMLRHGPRTFPFKEEDICEILSRATEVFASEQTLVEVAVPCMVYGDIHGQFSDLFRWFNLNGWPYKVRSLFLGDFVDRGSHGVDVMVLVAALKIIFPTSLYVIRGNHEEELLNRSYSFFDEVNSRFKPTVYPYFQKLFSQLPLAALINGRILAVHGGLSPHLKMLDDIRKIKRPVEEFVVATLPCDLVWSDPDPVKGAKGFRPNLEREPQNGIGQHFGADTVFDACKNLEIDMIIRGHQAPIQGYSLFARNRLLTLFSAPGYKGVEKETVNMGASLEINAAMQMKIRQIRVSEVYRKKRISNEQNYQKTIMKQKKERNNLSDRSEDSKDSSIERSTDRL